MLTVFAGTFSVPVDTLVDRVSKSINELQGKIFSSNLESTQEGSALADPDPCVERYKELTETMKEKRVKTALLIIDVQNCFLPGGNLGVPPVQPTGASGDTGNTSVPQFWDAIEHVMASGWWDATVISKDWHPPRHVSFASGWATAPDGMTHDAMTMDPMQSMDSSYTPNHTPNYHRTRTPTSLRPAQMTIPVTIDPSTGEGAPTMIPYKIKGEGDLIEQLVWPDHCAAAHDGGTTQWSNEAMKYGNEMKNRIRSGRIQASAPCTNTTCPEWDENDSDGAHVSPKLATLLDRYKAKLGPMFEVRKGTSFDVDSYSAFFGSSREPTNVFKYPSKEGVNGYVVDSGRSDLTAFLKSPVLEQATGESLDEVLTKIGIDNVVVVGIALDLCVKFSAVDAMEKKFQVFVPTQATMGVGVDQTGNFVATVTELREKGVCVVDDLLYKGD